MRLTITTLAVGLAMVTSVTALATSMPFIGSRDLKMTLSIAGPSSVTAYEPVILRQDLKNVSDRTLMGMTAADYTTRIEIRNAAGKLVAQTPLLDIPGDLIFSGHYLPKETHTVYLIISAIYPFKDAGKYTITVHEGMTQEDKAGFDSIAKVSVTLKVRPFDRKALDARLKQLFGPVIAANGGLPNAAAGMSSSAILKAMWSVRHDAIIPYLVQTAEFGADWPKYSARALYRIGTPKARQALKKLTERKDDAGKQARNGLTLSLRVSAYDWHVE